MESMATIIPIAAGKGGVGKTFLTANLAIALAQSGHRTLAVDMDLGGSNLHSFLGLPNRYPGIGDYLQAKSGSLDNLQVPTDIDNLTFLPGDGKTPFMANIQYAQKIKLINHLRKLPAEYILLDLGAGSSFNTLDFFGISEKAIIITTPDPPAIMNMLVFMKNFLLRSISRSFSSDHGLRNFLREYCKRPMEGQMTSVASLLDEIALEDPNAAQATRKLHSSYRPRIVFNFGDHPDELSVTTQIDKRLESVLSLGADYFGFIYYDPAVRQSIREQTPMLLQWPESDAAKSIYQIARRVEKYWNVAVEDSASRLVKSVQDAYIERQAR
jgi:flagellar biosynthesis protein FlhG